MVYVKVLTVIAVGKQSLAITCRHAISPIGEKIFAVLGVDRILYVSIDSTLGKDFAVRVVKGKAWNIVKVKPHKFGLSILYTIPKSFAKTLNISKGDKVIAIGRDETLEVIPVKIAIKKIGPFKEPLL